MQSEFRGGESQVFENIDKHIPSGAVLMTQSSQVASPHQLPEIASKCQETDHTPPVGPPTPTTLHA